LPNSSLAWRASTPGASPSTSLGVRLGSASLCWTVGRARGRPAARRIRAPTRTYAITGILASSRETPWYSTAPLEIQRWSFSRQSNQTGWAQKMWCRASLQKQASPSRILVGKWKSSTTTAVITGLTSPKGLMPALVTCTKCHGLCSQALVPSKPNVLR